MSSTSLHQDSAGGETLAPLGEDERRLLLAIRKGDERAFVELTNRHYETMKRVARAYVGSEASAQEVVQETWLAVFEGLERFEERSTLKTWIFRILVNRAKTRGMRERRTIPFAALDAADEPFEPAVPPDRFMGDDGSHPGHWASPPRPWEDPERRLLSLETRQRLKSAIAELPARQRLVLTLRDVEGLSAEEVCELLDLEPNNQRVLLHRARSKVRAALERYFETA
jgi:RNA polymerase sigma-70 factor (ECF subfamily)